MCTYQTELLALSAHGKTADGWSPMTRAAVYFDHPVSYPAPHALMIDITDPTRGAGHRLALEMDAASARHLAESILHALDSVPAALLDA